LTISNSQLANNFGLPFSFGGCLVAQRIAPIYATDLFERMGRSMALGRSSAIQERGHHNLFPVEWPLMADCVEKVLFR
jgi:hypothetical protein